MGSRAFAPQALGGGVLDERGEQLFSRRIVNDPRTFLELLAEIDESKIALEATYGWEWLADLLQEAGYELHLGHPLRTEAIASAWVKNDAVDARTLGHLLWHAAVARGLHCPA